MSKDTSFQRRFNAFYRVRRNAAWQKPFYSLLEQCKARKMSFRLIVETLRRITGRWEASFASKLDATLHGNQPVIDSKVLRNTGLSLATAKKKGAEGIHALRQTLRNEYRNFLRTADGRYLVTQFRRMYPGAKVSEVKMVDLVLWQTR